MTNVPGFRSPCVMTGRPSRTMSDCLDFDKDRNRVAAHAGLKT